MLGGHLSKDDPLYTVRRKEPFQHISLTQSEYALRSIRALTPTDGPEIQAAFDGLRTYTRDDHLYGNGFKPVGSRGKELVVGTRHTAAALGMFHACGRTPLNWEQTVTWMLTMRKGGGWRDQSAAGPDCNTTAAVISALLDWLLQRGDDHPKLRSQVQTAVKQGLDWLDSEYGQKYKYGWQYMQPSLALTDTCYVIQRVSSALSVNVSGLNEGERVKGYLRKLATELQPSGAFGRDERMAAANTVWAISAFAEWCAVYGADEFGGFIERGLSFIEQRVIHQRQSELMLINWTVLVQALSRILAVSGDQSPKLEMTAEHALTIRRLAELFPSDSKNGVYPHELIRQMPTELKGQFGSLVVFAATHGEHTNSDVTRLIRLRWWFLRLLPEPPQWLKTIGFVLGGAAACAAIGRAIGQVFGWW